MNVLFVCTGNTCRSPMAEELADDAADRSRNHDFEFQSAGTFACEGEPATPEAIEAMEEVGLNIERHRAQRLGQKIRRYPDLVTHMVESPVAVRHSAGIAPVDFASQRRRFVPYTKQRHHIVESDDFGSRCGQVCHLMCIDMSIRERYPRLFHQIGRDNGCHTAG